jgi:hypothetical protein
MKSLPFRVRSRKNSKYAFLHIGKTGGTSVVQLRDKCIEAGYRPPLIFGHDEKVKDLRRAYPRTQFSFVLRDPILRTISGFEHRLRHPSKPWRTEDAVCFAFFASAAEFLAALVSDDRRLQGAARFAEHNIRHIRRGYVHHFGTAAFARSLAGSVYFACDIGDLSDRIASIFTPAGVPEEFVSVHYRPALQSGGATEREYGKLDAGQVQRLRRHFAAEYEIYDALRELGMGVS